jgi:hypothetical protein
MAENRIAELEAEVGIYRAEEWLHKVYTEIEHQFGSGRRPS